MKINLMQTLLHWGCALATTTPDGSLDFQQELLAIMRDPRIKSLARRWARDPDVADDAIQAAYCALARVADPDAIVNLQAYFRQVLRHEVYHLCGQLGALLVDNFADLIDTSHGGPCGNAPAPRPLDEIVVTNLFIQDCLEAFAARRQELTAAVPGRSLDPHRYRRVIAAAAERLLRASLTGDVSDADSNPTLRAAYPDWFAEPGCPANTYHQRFRRARVDVHDLLRATVTRDDLYP